MGDTPRNSTLRPVPGDLYDRSLVLGLAAAVIIAAAGLTAWLIGDSASEGFPSFVVSLILWLAMAVATLLFTVAVVVRAYALIAGVQRSEPPYPPQRRP